MALVHEKSNKNLPVIEQATYQNGCISGNVFSVYLCPCNFFCIILVDAIARHVVFESRQSLRTPSTCATRPTQPDNQKEIHVENVVALSILQSIEIDYLLLFGLNSGWIKRLICRAGRCEIFMYLKASWWIIFQREL